MNINRNAVGVAVGLLLLMSAVPSDAEPVRVTQIRGYLHGWVVVKDLNNKILASGDLVQVPAGDRVITKFNLRFKDGSAYEEKTVYSQRKVFRLLSFMQTQKGPAFKTQETLTLDTASGMVKVRYLDKQGKPKLVSRQMPLPEDLANGMITTLLTDIDPKAQTKLSMLVSTPKPRVVKLDISAIAEDSFSVGGDASKAVEYLIKIDIGGLAGAAAKVAGEQPPPLHMWVSAGTAPAFLRSEGPLYADGPIWRIELASPNWPK